MCARALVSMRGRVCVPVDVSLFSIGAHVFHVTKCARNKTGHRAACELLD